MTATTPRSLAISAMCTPRWARPIAPPNFWERAPNEWQKAVPADYEADKVNELDAQLKTLKRRTAQKTSPDAPKPQ